MPSGTEQRQDRPSAPGAGEAAQVPLPGEGFQAHERGPDGHWLQGRARNILRALCGAPGPPAAPPRGKPDTRACGAAAGWRQAHRPDLGPGASANRASLRHAKAWPPAAGQPPCRRTPNDGAGGAYFILAKVSLCQAGCCVSSTQADGHRARHRQVALRTQPCRPTPQHPQSPVHRPHE